MLVCLCIGAPVCYVCLCWCAYVLGVPMCWCLCAVCAGSVVLMYLIVLSFEVHAFKNDEAGS